MKRSPSPTDSTQAEGAYFQRLYDAYRRSYGLKPLPLTDSTRAIFESDDPPKPKPKRARTRRLSDRDS